MNDAIPTEAREALAGTPCDPKTQEFLRLYYKFPAETRPAVAAMAFIMAGDGTERDWQTIRQWVEKMDAQGRGKWVSGGMRHLANGGDPDQIEGMVETLDTTASAPEILRSLGREDLAQLVERAGVESVALSAAAPRMGSIENEETVPMK